METKNNISVIIPNHNGRKTVGLCLDALYRSNYDCYEVIVVDDASTDSSVEIVERYPCKLVRLLTHSGAAKARNVGARNASGKVLFFIDSDCIVERKTLSLVNRAFNEYGGNYVIGGTYTSLSYDNEFFSDFQSVFINYCETKKISSPDYIAAHAMMMDRGVFEVSGGFREDFMPIIEDVEFSHRLKRSGIKLMMVPDIMVRHVFHFSLILSLKNAYRKAKYWTVYSLRNRDILTDSGTASVELKVNVLAHLLVLICLMTGLVKGDAIYLYGISAPMIINLIVNRRFLKALYRVKGAVFAFLSGVYYVCFYPFPVGIGALAGNIRYLRH